jgi:hypothetical protein
MVMPAWFSHFRAMPGKRELLAPPGHGCLRLEVRSTSREGIGSITSRRSSRSTDDEFLAWKLGITVAEVKRRRVGA